MRLPSLILIFFLTFLMHIATTTAHPQAVLPAGSSCADLVNFLPPQWQKNLKLRAPANATANPYCYYEGMQLNGTIPDGLGGLTSLQLLDLSNNSLTGTIPDMIGNLTKLRALIPYALGNLTNLQQLDLSGTQLSGPVLDLSRVSKPQDLLQHLRNIDETRVCIGWIRLPPCTEITPDLPTLAIIFIVGGIVFFATIIIVMRVMICRKSKKSSIIPTLLHLKYRARKSLKAFWARQGLRIFSVNAPPLQEYP
ncbi:hypothetical protein BDK51DRAFT_28315 [Blyttiomyces helicus]|uniref:L domain-like protein n=1 Tax=Blyttiomyces helicus TaxID=388810 RepID=A0A4P9WLC8_9FUNG|nr:hypothetical protein BDK51DRAFT_28315 [Blyttiomyces helicus]|eukprot:RKO93841.1 hypothetical protein BDK51DRAFT_28315 [Blyttiomyces helicus]